MNIWAALLVEPEEKFIPDLMPNARKKVLYRIEWEAERRKRRIEGEIELRQKWVDYFDVLQVAQVTGTVVIGEANLGYYGSWGRKRR